MQKKTIPVKAIQRAYFVVSWCQCDSTSRTHVTEREMMPIIMKKRVVTHSGGSRGGIHILSRPWIVWHCRTSPIIKAPSASPVFIQSGFATLAMAKISAARNKHPEIMVSLSIFHNFQKAVGSRPVSYLLWWIAQTAEMQLSLPLFRGRLMGLCLVHHSSILEQAHPFSPAAGDMGTPDSAHLNPPSLCFRVAVDSESAVVEICLLALIIQAPFPSFS